MAVDVLEVFNSISGEVNPWHQGCLTTFIRLAKCNCRCWYCDTPHSQSLATVYQDVSGVIELVNTYYQKTGKLCITGGEPLLQMKAVEALIENFPNCWIETNGTCDFSNLIGKVTLVTDYKLDIMEEIPISFYHLKGTDFIKFVVCGNKDIGDAQKIQQVIQMTGCECNFAYSPIHEQMDVQDLFDRLIENPLPNTIINAQIHKYLGMK